MSRTKSNKMSTRQMLKDLQEMEVELIEGEKVKVGTLEPFQQFAVIMKFFTMGGQYKEKPDSVEAAVKAYVKKKKK